jgi:hypothetical protein
MDIAFSGRGKGILDNGEGLVERDEGRANVLVMFANLD